MTAVFIRKRRHIRILVVCHYTDKNIGFHDFAGIRINQPGGITCSVNFRLLCRFLVDMHGCTALVLILLKLVSELGIHEGFFTGMAAVFHGFSS